MALAPTDEQIEQGQNVLDSTRTRLVEVKFIFDCLTYTLLL